MKRVSKASRASRETENTKSPVRLAVINQTPSKQLAGSVNTVSLGTCSFSAFARRSAEDAGCRYLFELPGSLINDQATNAAVILCPGGNKSEIFLMIYNSQQSQILVAEPKDIPQNVLSFAWSYVQVLLEIPKTKAICLQ